MKVKKSVMVLIPFAILLIISGILCFVCYGKTEEVTNYLVGEERSAIIDLVTNQDKVNRKLSSISNEKKYTLKDAYVELNPYDISPLSAVIIFRTNKEEEIEVYVNDKFVTKMEASKKHIIPIYGLYEDYENKVKLVNGDVEKEYTIKTEKSNIEYPLNVTYKSEEVNGDELYFTVASYKTYLTGWDIDGKLRFYLTVDNRMDVEWLSNGHFLIGTAQGQFAENFVSFVEMDYLGRVYNYYVPENGYSFEFQTLSNGNYMLAGGNNPVYVKEQLVYEINPTTGDKVSEMNIATVIKSIDPDFDLALLGQKAIRNAFVFKEDTKELIMSMRGWDAVVSFNYETKSVNWVFTNPNNEIFNKPVWKNYLLSLKSGRYPLGQHSVILTTDGNLAFFNNGYNRLHGFENGGEDKVSAYSTNYSSAEVYKIVGKNISLVTSIDLGKKLFSHQYGSINMTSDNHYLVDFGYVLHDDYRNKDGATLSNSEANPDNISARIVETDKTGKVLFEASSEEGKFRAFKHGLYLANTPNTNLDKYCVFEKIEANELKESNYQKEGIKDAEEWIYSCVFTKNTFKTNYDIKSDDQIDFYFVNKTGKIFIMNYKDKDSSDLNKIFNANLANGKYALYIKVNGDIYKTNKVYKF